MSRNTDIRAGLPTSSAKRGREKEFGRTRRERLKRKGRNNGRNRRNRTGKERKGNNMGKGRELEGVKVYHYLRSLRKPNPFRGSMVKMVKCPSFFSFHARLGLRQHLRTHRPDMELEPPAATRSKRNGLQRDGLHPTSDGLQPNSDGMAHKGGNADGLDGRI